MICARHPVGPVKAPEDHGDTMTSTPDRTSYRARVAKSALSTIPIVLAGSLAMSMNLTGPIALDDNRGADNDDAQNPSSLRDNVRKALNDAQSTHNAESTEIAAGELSIAATAPASYTVTAGDTISGIAGRFGLSTASVLAMNGLGWKSVIHPGQVLMLSQTAKPVVATPTAAPTTGGSYTIARGDTIGGIAAKFGVATQVVLNANGLSARSIIYPGQRLTIPGSSTVAAAPSTPSASPVATSSATRYTIVPGDTASSIASKLGVSVAQLLAANNLSASATIYAGKTLVVPAVQAAGSVPSTTQSVVGLTAEMEKNARTIVSVGRGLGVNDYGLVIALATAAQESTLRNLTWGDLDSVGLFQQRPSAGWGTVAQLTTPEHSARLFFGGTGNPNAGYTRGLLDIPGWQSMTVTQAAQAVQISAYPDAYAKWEASARSWLASIG